MLGDVRAVDTGETAGSEKLDGGPLHWLSRKVKKVDCRNYEGVRNLHALMTCLDTLSILPGASG